MKIFISADIEGVAGVVVPQHQRPGHPEYEDARRLMTEEANAAIAGAFDGGASEVVVNDSHGPMINLLPELLDPRAELIRGNIKHGGMFAGLDESFAGVMCVGYHAAAADYGVLAHTTNDFAFSAVRLDGKPASEAMCYGAYASSLGVPIILLSGDDVIEREDGALFSDAVFVRVKTAMGQRAARSLSPGAARKLIREGAETATRKAAQVQPFTISLPARIEFDLTSVTLADICATIPVADRSAPLTVGFAAATPLEAIRWMRVCSMLSGQLREPGA